MSAFYDIWISKRVPEYRRMLNDPWVNGLHYSLSLPEGKTDYITVEESETYSLIAVGAFYEPIDIGHLFSHCINYAEGKEHTFTDPAGHYILFLKNKANANWYVFTNRLGTYHAYYRQEQGNNAISTYYLGLAKSSNDKQLDWEGITGFMGMGFFPLNTTYLKNIKILEPASHYCFDAKLNLLHKRRYWEWKHEPSVKNTQENVGLLHNIMQSSLRFAVHNKRVALPISGGLDSRTVAGAVTDSHIGVASLWGFSYGYSNTSVETDIAGKIAVARSIPFSHYTVPNYLFDKIDLVTDSVELFQYIDGTRQACMSELLEQNSEVVIGGHWGDVWMDDMGVTDGTDMGMLEAFRKKIIKRGSAWLLNEVCSPYFSKGKEYLDSYFSSYISKYSYIADPDFRMKIFKSDQWSFRWTLASIRMYQAGAFPILPFYDKRIVDLFTTIPTSLVKGRNLQIEYIKKYQPDLARIKWQEYGSNLYLYKWLNNRNIIYRVINKVRRMLSKEAQIRRPWEVFYLNPEGRKCLETKLLNPIFNNIVPAEKINSLLDMFYKDPSAGNGYTISMLLTFSQFISTVF
ncbi:MAG: hypothetical protein H0X33_02320 [Taibaiella sp.]|nr:hypothetical protein [Taibaiella sp.]